MGQKIFWVKNFWAKEIQSKRFGSEIFLFKKKFGRVNPRWRIYDPPPKKEKEKIVGLDCC